MKKISDTDLNNLNELVSIEKIRKIIEILRDPDKGCPWDIKQDYQSLAPYSIEEAYELVNAIETNDINNIKSELGDLLLQVVLISQVAADKGDFNFDDVANEISKKIIRRHPQIFDHTYKINDLPNQSWERIKSAEKNDNKTNRKNILDTIETNIPSNIRSIKIQKKVASFNFDWDNETQVLTKIDEELHELKEAIMNNQKENIEEELGDLFFTILNLTRHLKLDPDQTIRKANNKFILRFNTMENILEQTNLKWHDLSKADFEKLWNKAKSILKEDKNEL
ncbi:nucleoside triphosphate pyrophosphohydrolase [Alphaproteobacteria bacterium]|nr:nucleoside triphosphate pyrophosphohydrolase [Alphaproteobacteria bacterium]